MKNKFAVRLSSLKKAIKLAGKALNLAPGEIADVLRSARVGSEAEYHTASRGVLAYYAIEGTMLTTAYFERPQLWHDFYQKVDEHLNSLYPNPRAFSEPINHCELAIYPI